MGADAGDLDAVLGSIVDGRDVDWRELERGNTIPIEELDALKALHSIHVAHRMTAHPPLERGYRILDTLGDGAFGTVHRALDLALGREIALKVLKPAAFASPGARERFIAEARNLARVDHPNVLRVHSIDEDDGDLRIACELIEGVSLDRWVRERGPLEPEEAARIVIDVCRALTALHEQGLVHLDVKPANVMRARDGRIVLLDFGFAKRLAVEGEGGQTAVGGTPLCMAPEQFDAVARVDARTDVYGAGVLLYWLTSGNYPHTASSIQELKEAVTSGRSVPLARRRPDVDAAFATIVSRATEVDAERRFDDAAELERALVRFLDEPNSRDGTVRSTGRRRVLVAAAFAAVAAGAWVVWGVRSSDATDPLECRIAIRALRGTTGFDPTLATSRIRVGDRLHLEVECEESLYLYVFDEDRAEHSWTLFPLGSEYSGNPLPAGAGVHVPTDRAGLPQHWIVDTKGGGNERILVLASRKPSLVGELLARAFDGATPVSTDRSLAGLDAATRADLYRGAGLVSATLPVPSRDSLTQFFALMQWRMREEPDTTVLAFDLPTEP